MEYKVKIISISEVTHDVKRFVTEKPKNFTFIPGQAVDISIDSEVMRDEKRPFTVTSLNEDEYLEFLIKGYIDHNGVTKKLHEAKEGDGLILSEPFGSIRYKGEGVFIAGGTGITPFLAIMRVLQKENRLGSNCLLYSNKTSKDIIMESELKELYKNNVHNLALTITQEKRERYENGRIDELMLKKYINNNPKYLYVCGPSKFVGDIRSKLKKLNISEQSLVI